MTKSKVIDADGHIYENHEEIEQYFEGKYGGMPSYADCVSKHAAFHQEAGKVAQTINAKSFTHAKEMMGANTPYALAANDFIIAIGVLKKEAGL
jgi:methyl-accepting chemotaxis protein